MSVYVNNIVISAGSSFSQDLTLSEVNGTATNLIGYGISSYIRKHPKSSTKTAEFNIGITSAIQGQVTISLASTISTNIKEGRYVYDVLATNTNGKKSIIIEGNVLVRAGISS
jgi:hypothetical protein